MRPRPAVEAAQGKGERHVRKLLVGLSLALSAATASAQVPLHYGLHLHFDVGIGTSRSSASQSGDSAEIRGAGLPLSFAIGGAVAPNLILGASFWSTVVADPTFEVNGVSADSSATYTTTGFGPMLTVYVPGNVFVSLVPSLTRLTIEEGDSTARTQMGAGLRASIGKEWRIGYDWGLGVALVGHICSNKDSDGGPTWTTSGGGVVFTASYH
jgi:hypothetical protein